MNPFENKELLLVVNRNRLWTKLSLTLILSCAGISWACFGYIWGFFDAWFSLAMLLVVLAVGCVMIALFLRDLRWMISYDEVHEYFTRPSNQPFVFPILSSVVIRAPTDEASIPNPNDQTPNNL